jgi:hypothetical protein
MNIGQVLLKMGYTEFTCTDTYESIVWIVEPETIPSKEEVLDMVSQLDTLEQAEQDAKAAAKESAIAKLSVLGLSEDEIKALVGA